MKDAAKQIPVYEQQLSFCQEQLRKIQSGQATDEAYPTPSLPALEREIAHAENKIHSLQATPTT